MIPSIKNSMKEASTKILLVDDREDTLDLLRLLLSERGYATESTLEPEKVVNLAEKGKPDLILLDIMMPKINGYQVCHSLRKNQSTHDIPVIFMSALDETEEKIKGFELGCVDYITKPFDLDEVMVRVNHQLEVCRLQKELKEKNQILKQELEIRIELEHKLRSSNQKLKNMAIVDSLTGIANRRKFDQKIQQEWLRLTREKAFLSLIMIDVDYFKLYNDSYGHQAGDDCLQQVAQAISRTVKRPADLVARYGGEEFAVILPSTDKTGATHVANSIKAAIEELNIPHTSSTVANRVTVSQGVATTIPNTDNLYESLICLADVALYEAKDRGRNSFVSYSL